MQMELEKKKAAEAAAQNIEMCEKVAPQEGEIKMPKDQQSQFQEQYSQVQSQMQAMMAEITHLSSDSSFNVKELSSVKEMQCTILADMEYVKHTISVNISFLELV